MAYRVILSPGYKAWQWNWRRAVIRVTRYALGETDRFGLSITLILKGQP